jgi:uncharacterized NAD-dependent epimerase/dehydratase family protein
MFNFASKSSMDIQKLYAFKDHFATRKTGDEMLLVPIKKEVMDFSQFITLSEVAAYIWEQWDAQDDVASIVHKITNEFEINNGNVTEDTIDFFREIEKLMDAVR